MNSTFFEDQAFKGLDFSEKNLPRGTYENCTFINCVFSGTDLSGIFFISSTFENCDLSLIKTSGTAFREIKFKGCKLLGVHFDECNLFLLSMYFNNCQLNLSSFYKLKLKKIIFKDCSLQEVDFAEADLSAARFSNCDMMGAVFVRSILEKADFGTAFNYSIDPEENRMKKAVFSQHGLAGLLGKYNIVIE